MLSIVFEGGILPPNRRSFIGQLYDIDRELSRWERNCITHAPYNGIATAMVNNLNKRKLILEDLINKHGEKPVNDGETIVDVYYDRDGAYPKSYKASVKIVDHPRWGRICTHHIASRVYHTTDGKIYTGHRDAEMNIYEIPRSIQSNQNSNRRSSNRN